MSHHQAIPLHVPLTHTVSQTFLLIQQHTLTNTLFTNHHKLQVLVPTSIYHLHLPPLFTNHYKLQVLVPTSEFIQKLTAARLAADVADVPTILIARTDALGAYLLTSDVDERDRAFCTGECLPGALLEKENVHRKWVTGPSARVSAHLALLQKENVRRKWEPPASD